jgi:proteasome lid subunit RPN8/RPN11
MDDFEELDVAGDKVWVGANNRVYEERFGLIDCLAPVKLPPEDSTVYVEGVRWGDFPPHGELAWLYDNFFRLYDREVLMLVGKKRDGTGWLYHVPEQTGTAGEVTWEAEDGEMGIFSKQASWVGTIHIHPGTGCQPSQTDVDDWAKPDKSGLHVIFGRDGSYAIYGAIAGQTFPLRREGSLRGIVRVHVSFSTSQGRRLKTILKKPKPVVKRTRHVRLAPKDPPSVAHPQSAGVVPEEEPRYDYVYDYAEETLDDVGALAIDEDQLLDLRILPYKGRYYLMTKEQEEEFDSQSCGASPLPPTRELCVVGIGTGGTDYGDE